MRTRMPVLLLTVLPLGLSGIHVFSPTASRAAAGEDLGRNGAVHSLESPLEVRQEANQDLDEMARELAKLAATPGFRGFIRSEIAQSRNREAIVELDAFIERASRRPDAPPGLSQFGELRGSAKSRFTGLDAEFKGFDLYIPVEAHRTRWRGGDDFVVAFAPVGDEEAIQEIVGYSVRNGQQVRLDAAKAPDTVVLIVAPCEHETHEQQAQDERITPADRVLPEADVTGREPAEQAVDQTEGNSYVGLRRVYIRDVKEPWYRGSPEIYLWFAQRKGNYCEEKWVYELSYYMERINDDHVWYTTWYPPNTSRCRTDGQTCFYFTEDYPTKMYVRFYESDYLFSKDKEFVFFLYPSISCSFRYDSGDDYVDHGWMYRNNFGFERDYKQDMGNAYVLWHKIH